MSNIETCICGCFVFDKTARKCVKCGKKRKPGQPRKENPKVRVTFRLDADVVLEIRKQPNQAKYIEGLVTKQLKVNR